MLALIIECVTYMPFNDYPCETVFTPCDMGSTGYYELDMLPEHCASNYIYDEQRGGYRTGIYSVDVKGTGAGGAFTTVGDVARF